MRRPLAVVSSGKWVGPVVVLILIASILSFVLVSRELYAAIRTQEATVTVKKQEDSPLTLKITSITPSDPKSPTFSYEVTNTSSKVIKAYAIRNDATVGSGTSSGVAKTYLHDASAFLYPGSRRLESSSAVTYAGEVKKVALSVDYVEFEDGTTWGGDSFKISENFAGQRAGYRAFIEKVREVYRAKGQAALLSALESDVVDLYPQSDKSQRWKDGFNNGLKIAHLRLKYVKKNNGVSALEDELEKPLEGPEKE
jgi:hypothetical protein